MYTLKIPQEGDVIVCQQGHVIAQARVNLQSGSLLDPDDFAWVETKPRVGDLAACPHCGSEYVLDGFACVADFKALSAVS